MKAKKTTKKTGWATTNVNIVISRSYYDYKYNLSFHAGITELLACFKGTLILSGDETLRNAEVTSSVTEYYWKVRYSVNDFWTTVIYCTSLPVCTMIKPVLPDGTKVRVSENGTLVTLEHSAGGNAGGHAQFLFQVELENDVRVHIFKISFAAICEFC